MPRPIWRGALSFGLVEIPIGIFPAERREDVSFRLLDRRDMAPVGYRRVNKRTGEEVPWEQIVRGLEVDEGEFVVMDDDELRAAAADGSDRTIEIVQFVDGAEIAPVFFERPYYLAPLRKDQRGYAILREVLRTTGRVGIARVTLRTREQIAAVIARGRVLVLDMLRFAEEIRDPGELAVPDEDPAALGIGRKELDLAEQLVDGMTAAWEPERFRDRYKERVLAAVQRKREAGEAALVPVVEVPVREAVEPRDIISILKRSLEEVGAGEKKATGGRRRAARRSGAKRGRAA